MARRDADIDRLASEPIPRRFSAPWGFAVIHLDTYPARSGLWRVTWLWSNGEPHGHFDASSYEDALFEVWANGYDLSEATSKMTARE